MNEPDHRFAAWQKENILLNELKAVKPELFQTERKCSSTLLPEIGIETVATDKQQGYLKYLPFDFIVEEIRKDGSIITIDRLDAMSIPTTPSLPTIYADLVKIGISSIEAVDQLSKALACDRKQLSYAGIKDTVAITAQKISIRNIPLEKIQQLNVPQLFLKNLSFGKGIVGVGDLQGNRFTILIRTTATIDESTLQQKVSRINEQGLYNYYGPQRFGSPRYISHILGKYLLQGEFEKVVHTILTQTSKFEWLFVTQLRQKANTAYGDWKMMKELFIQVPQTFRSELDLLERLLQWNGIGNKWIYALGFAPEQIDFWTKSYASYLANTVLHTAEKTGEYLPEQIPLLLNTAVSEIKNIETLYGVFLDKDNTRNFRNNLRQLPWIRMGENSYLSTKIHPHILHIKKIPQGIVMSFELPKGAYATTLLYELFDIVEGEESIKSLDTSYVDTKKELGVGSFDSIYEWAMQYIDTTHTIS